LFIHKKLYNCENNDIKFILSQNLNKYKIKILIEQKKSFIFALFIYFLFKLFKLTEIELK